MTSSANSSADFIFVSKIISGDDGWTTHKCEFLDT